VRDGYVKGGYHQGTKDAKDGGHQGNDTATATASNAEYAEYAENGGLRGNGSGRLPSPQRT
jgi:hypothetical protein